MKKLAHFIAISVFIVSYSSNSKPTKTISIEPSEEITRDYKFKDFSIVLDDMKIDEEPSLLVYQHKYKMLTVEMIRYSQKNCLGKL